MAAEKQDRCKERGRERETMRISGGRSLRNEKEEKTTTEEKKKKK